MGLLSLSSSPYNYHANNNNNNNNNNNTMRWSYNNHNCSNNIMRRRRWITTSSPSSNTAKIISATILQRTGCNYSMKNRGPTLSSSAAVVAATTAALFAIASTTTAAGTATGTAAAFQSSSPPPTTKITPTKYNPAFLFSSSAWSSSSRRIGLLQPFPFPSSTTTKIQCEANPQQQQQQATTSPSSSVSLSPSQFLSKQLDSSKFYERINPPNRMQQTTHAVGGLVEDANKIAKYEIYKHLRQSQDDNNHNNHNNVVTAIIDFGHGVDGHPGVVHGGILALVLDDIFGFAFEALGVPYAVTANLSLDYRAPIPAGSSVMVKVQLQPPSAGETNPRKLYFQGQILSLPTKRQGDDDDDGATITDENTILYTESTCLYIIPRSIWEQMQQQQQKQKQKETKEKKKM